MCISMCAFLHESSSVCVLCARVCVSACERVHMCVARRPYDK